MEKIILKKLIYKNYLKTSLTSILFIEIILIIIYFNANNTMLNKSVDFILEDIKKNLTLNVVHVTEDINRRFDYIEKLTNILQIEHENFFEYQNSIKIKKTPQFAYSDNGMYYKIVDNGGASVVVSKNTKITKKFEQKLIKSELFDRTFKSIVNSDDIIIAAYFNSYDNLGRYYPFLLNSQETFPSDIVMKNYNFYYEADLKHNPEKKAVWTDVYLDPAGQGWLMSSIIPIYHNGFLEGVTGIDVTVQTLINSLLSFKLPYNGVSFLIDKNGKFIAITEEVKKVLKINDKQKYIYKDNEKIDKTVFKDKAFNLFKYKDKNVVEIFKNIVNNKSYSGNVLIEKDKYVFFSKNIDKTPWYIISLIAEKKIISEVRYLEDYYKNLGYLIIVLIIAFYLVFFFYLHKKAKDFVDIINKPLSKIIEMTKNLGLKKDLKKLEPCGIVEIDVLNDNFNLLSSELSKRTEKLVKSETQRVFNEKLANTDALTGVYNRRFLVDFSEKYIKIVKREHSELSILLIDIDNFKTKNDTYGHNTGDLIIKKLITCIKNIVRENDIIIRFGGDEFIVLLPNTGIINSQKVARKLILYINEINQLESKELNFTVTIGTAEYKKEDLTVDNIIKRADTSLYKAKKLGKNCVV